MSNAYNIIKRISEKMFNSTSEANLSKALGFCFIKYHIEPEQDSDDIMNSCVDGANDRGFDYIHYDDSEEGTVKVIFIQCKYSESDTSINEGEVSKTINNVKRFPEIEGNLNNRLSEAVRKWHAYKANDELKLEKICYYLNFGKFTENSITALKDQANNGFEVEIYDLDRFESEVLFDPTLPSFSVKTENKIIEYLGKALIGIIDLDHFFQQEVVKKSIESQKIFHHNVRGLMNFRKNSISENIKATALESPEMMALRNNGITITCDDYKTEDGDIYSLRNASIVNGQQTIRTLWRICDKHRDKISVIKLPAKILKINSQTDEGKHEILNIAKSTNRQNPIRESDLRSNEPEQEQIQLQSELLPEFLKFKYITKRTVELDQNVKNITKDEAILLLSIFIHQNPSDRVEGLYRYKYKTIFENSSAEHIAIINLIRKFIQDQHYRIDNNFKNAGVDCIWSDSFYKKFRKATTINHCLYLLSVVISKRFNYSTHVSRLKFVSSVYEKMKNGDGYNIENYFSPDFVTTFNNVTRQYIKRIFDVQTSTSDALRKECDHMQLMQDWDNFVAMRLEQSVFTPQLMV